MIKKCIGCGSLLQTIDKNKEGYVSNKVYDKILFKLMAKTELFKKGKYDD